MLSRRLVAVGRQQLAQQHHLGWVDGVSLKNKEMHLARKQHKTALALMDGADQKPAFGRFDVDGGLEHLGVNRPAEQPRFEHLDAILFHDLTMTSQQRRGNP